MSPKIKTTLRRVALYLSPYKVAVRMPSGRVVAHKAFSRADALAWAACYAADCDIAVGFAGRLICGRFAH